VILRRDEWFQPVVVLAGDTAPEHDGHVTLVRGNLLRAFEGFHGTIVSGGTTAGVSGLAGDIAAALQGAARVIGYLPRAHAGDPDVDARYTALVLTDGADFGPLEPRLYWADLRAAGVDPADVRVLGIGGGAVSQIEYKMALALGARVAFVEPLERAAAAVWGECQGHPRLQRLPNEANALRAYLMSEITC